jgi:D-tyrosyl-tRNA(Tyr) deacylase
LRFRREKRGVARIVTPMRAVIQRVRMASVSVGGDELAAIGRGLVVFLGVGMDDGLEDVEWLAGKTAGLRLFPDETGGWNCDVTQVGGEVLVVSQFTLFASTKKGTKPSWHRAAKPEAAAPMCEAFTRRLAALLPGRVHAGRFGAMMDVSLVNDGPVTLLIDTRQRE